MVPSGRASEQGAPSKAASPRGISSWRRRRRACGATSTTMPPSTDPATNDRARWGFCFSAIATIVA